MLTKLLKYEFKATARVILPIAGGVLAINLLTNLLGHFINNTSRTAPIVGVFMALLTIVSFLGLLAVLAVCFFSSIQRYYKLLGEQGYLLLALPVQTWQHIAAKLICSIVWTLLGMFYFQLCTAFTLSALEDDFAFTFTLPDSKDIPFFAVFFVLVLALIAGAQLHAYLACAFAAQFTQQRLLTSIISYFCLGFIGQALVLAGIAVFAVMVYPSIDTINNFMVLHNGLLLSVSVLCLAAILVDALLWALTQWLMSKRLNLA